MKIILVNSVFGTGSTGKIVRTLFREMSFDNKVYVLYGRGKKIKNTENVRRFSFQLESKIHHFLSLFLGNMYGGMYFSTMRLISLIKKIKPDVVNLHCLNGYFVNIYKLLKWLGNHKIKTVLTMHADFMMTGGCGYAVECNNYISKECKNCKNFKKFNFKFSVNAASFNYRRLNKSLSTFDANFIKINCVSPWLQKRYKLSPLYRNFTVNSVINPVDDVFFDAPGANPYKTKRNFLYITPDINDSVKCGFLIKDLANMCPNLNFTIICAKDIDFSYSNKNITYIKGGVDQNKLKDYYFYADATILLSKRETFSMVVAESLSCNTPIIGFKSGGPESIALTEYSTFVDFNDIKALSEELIKYTKPKDDIRSLAYKTYSAKKIVCDYLKTYIFGEQK